MTHPKIIALDIGSVRIGVSVSDGLQFLAHPLTTLKWTDEGHFVEDVKRLINENNCDTLVIGMPYTLKGSDSDQTKRVRSLVDILKDKLEVKIETIDERLTTKMAENMLREVNKKASRNRHIIDQLAAVNILQIYLDKNRV